MLDIFLQLFQDIHYQLLTRALFSKRRMSKVYYYYCYYLFFPRVYNGEGEFNSTIHECERGRGGLHIFRYKTCRVWPFSAPFHVCTMYIHNILCYNIAYHIITMLIVNQNEKRIHYCHEKCSYVRLVQCLDCRLDGPWTPKAHGSDVISSTKINFPEIIIIMILHSCRIDSKFDLFFN